MIEVMIALFILSVGLLGIAALQTQAFSAEAESYDRGQALILLDSIISRIKNNKTAAGCYGITSDTTNGKPFAGFNNTTTFACAGFGTTATRAVADADLAAWDAALKGDNEKIDGKSIGGASNSRGCITYAQTPIGSIRLTVSVAWTGRGPGFAAADTCAIEQYGTTNTARRVVSRTIELGSYD